MKQKQNLPWFLLAFALIWIAASRPAAPNPGRYQLIQFSGRMPLLLDTTTAQTWILTALDQDTKWLRLSLPEK